MTTSGGASAVHKPALRGVQHQWAAVVAAIAGAYLVFSANDPQSRIAVAIYTASLVLLLAVWSGAAVGIVVSMFRPAAPKWVGAVLAIAAGYTIVPYFGPIVRHMSTVELTLIIVGGVAYTVGAIV